MEFREKADPNTARSSDPAQELVSRVIDALTTTGVPAPHRPGGFTAVGDAKIAVWPDQDGLTPVVVFDARYFPIATVHMKGPHHDETTWH